MNKTKLKSYIEVTTNIAVLLVAVVLLGNFAWVRLSKQPMPRAEGGLRKGDEFSLLPGVDYSKSPKTLLIALSTKCDHCTETIPFWKRVFETNIENKNGTRFVAVFPETAVEVGRYLHEQQLGLNTIPGINYKAINLPGTPSAVLLDNEGKIVNFWIGKPSKDAEQEILDAVTRSS